jgi:hypothetical protein
MISKKYFGEKGLTSTSANYLTNVGQEALTGYKTTLDNLRWYSETMVLLSSGKEVPMVNGNTPTLEEIKVIINEMSKINAFCAWIREAIKAKEVLEGEFPDFDEWKADKETVSSPARPQRFTEADVVAEFDVKKLNEYLTLEAYAATLGKLIHQNGSISTARKQLHNVLETPNSVDKMDSDVVITRYTPILNTNEVDDWYMQLQNKYREVERQLNQIKYQIKEEVATRNRVAQTQYNAELRKYNAEQEQLFAEYRTESEAYRNEIAKLKIIVPRELEGTFNHLQSLGK